MEQMFDVSHFLLWENEVSKNKHLNHMYAPNVHDPHAAPVVSYVFFYFICYCVRAGRLQWGMRDKRGHSFISHTPSTHAHTSLTGLSSLLSQASLVLSVSLKRKKAKGRGRERE